MRVAHAAGLAVNTWTCDDPDRIRWLADLGVDAVITNVPDVALAARPLRLASCAVSARPSRSEPPRSYGHDEVEDRRARGVISRRSVSPRWSPSTWYGNGP